MNLTEELIGKTECINEDKLADFHLENLTDRIDLAMKAQKELHKSYSKNGMYIDEMGLKADMKSLASNIVDVQRAIKDIRGRFHR